MVERCAPPRARVGAGCPAGRPGPRGPLVPADPGGWEGASRRRLREGGRGRRTPAG